MDSPVGSPVPLHVVGATLASPTLAPAGATTSVRAQQYLQQRPATPAKRVSRQDVDRITRLYEAGDAAHLVLQFGDYKGATLFQVAQLDPAYIRSLALTAQRPQVRAAARELVLAIEANERTGRAGRSLKARRTTAS
jgi:hypothetical protein